MLMVAPESACSCLMVAPPRPMMSAICRSSIGTLREPPNCSMSSSSSATAFCTATLRPVTLKRPVPLSSLNSAPPDCSPSRRMVAPPLPMITGTMCVATSRSCWSTSSCCSSACCIRATAGALPRRCSSCASGAGTSAQSCVSCSRLSNEMPLPPWRDACGRCVSLASCALLQGSVTAHCAASAKSASSVALECSTATSLPRKRTSP
mmetsp:Transcript_28569/g.67959  ORF Transcript_28569/g.67959 Transcript_28569/m.67959 type:complete len:207 (-) Transcript_28569:2756-3376(-)